MVNGARAPRIKSEWVTKGRHERLYAVALWQAHLTRTGTGTGCEKMALPSQPGDRDGRDAL